MRQTVLRFVLFACVGALAACNANTRTTAGQTPLPSKTTLAQANSAAAPEQGYGKMTAPLTHYYARTDAHLKGVSFGVWANGRPAISLDSPGMNVDITKEMRPHANVLAITWQRTLKNGTGSVVITNGSKIVARQSVGPKTAATGKHSIQLIAGS